MKSTRPNIKIDMTVIPCTVVLCLAVLVLVLFVTQSVTELTHFESNSPTKLRKIRHIGIPRMA